MSIFKQFIHQPLGKTMAKSKLGTLWNTHVGREGLIGALTFDTLWESGTTKDAKGRAKRAVEGLKDTKQQRFDDMRGLMNESMLANIFKTNTKADGLINAINTGGNLDTDNSRGLQTQRIIRESVKATNLTFNNDLQARIRDEDSHEVGMSALDQQQSAIDRT
jgi:hypothetical protein